MPRRFGQNAAPIHPILLWLAEAAQESGTPATITDSVVFDHVHVGAGSRVHRAILDKNVVLADGATVGVDRERDLARGFTVTESGITVVGKGLFIER